jgi:sugar (pentulose or hexulose) kinase
MLISSQGDLLEAARVAYEPPLSLKPGWAEQDPEVYWESLCRASRQLKTSSPGLFAKIGGVGVTTQRNTMINVDQDGAPLRPAITWLDQRKSSTVYRPNRALRLVYWLIGMDEAIAKTQADGKCNWIMQNQPDIWKKTHKYLQVSGFLNFRLTGDFVDSVASQIGHIPMSYKRLQWAAPNELTARMFPTPETMLPKIVSPGELVGTISRKASRETGLSKGIPVAACGSDKGCETIGMGVIDDKMASLSFGTTATVQTTTKKYFEPIRFMPPYPAAVPGHYNPEVEIFRGYWMITWFKNEFAHKEVLEAGQRGIPPEALMNELLRQSPPGSMGLMVQPYWGPGLKQPAAKGAMIGFGDVHRKSHVYRAVIEGLGYALLEGLHRIEKAGKLKCQTIAVSGGASQSDEICRITADIFDLPLMRGKTWETSGLGAAIVASVGIGIHSSFDSAIKTMVEYDKCFTPDKKNSATYKRLYDKVYRKMYDALHPLYREIRQITGYPEMLE